MKTIRFTTIMAALMIAASFGCIDASAWSGNGHRTIVLIAQNHLTDNARKNIAEIMQMPAEELYTEASWMDKHRKDKEYKFTGKWHSVSMTPDCIYDPSLRMATGGDCITGLNAIDYNLSHMRELELTDSAKVANIRYLIHIVGDMHCLAHTSMQGVRQGKWTVEISHKGDSVSFHTYFDRILYKLYPKTKDVDIAEIVDNATASEIAEAQAGTFYDWIQDNCHRGKVAYTTGTYMELFPEGYLETFRPAVEDALRHAGYRLAYLLNKYFDY